MRLIYVAVFGLLGVFARYFVGLLAAERMASPFPYGTLAINTLGSFLIGIIYVLGAEHALISTDLRVGLMVGFLGGFTTFSSYSLDFVRLLESGDWRSASLYFTLGPAAGAAAAMAGLAIARILLR